MNDKSFGELMAKFKDGAGGGSPLEPVNNASGISEAEMGSIRYRELCRGAAGKLDGVVARAGSGSGNLAEIMAMGTANGNKYFNVESRDGRVIVNSPEQTVELVNDLLEKLKDKFNCKTWRSICPFFGLEDNENSARTLRAWRGGKLRMPEAHWRMLHVYLYGFSA